MNRDDIQKLLGGYAAGNLTPDEEQALFAAALEDQDLFDALGKEQALRDLLRDPAAKAEVLAALDEPARRRGGWMAWLRSPLVGGLAAAGIAGIGGIVVWQGTHPAAVAPPPVLMAEAKLGEVKPAQTPPPPPKPAEIARPGPANRRPELPLVRDARHKDLAVKEKEQTDTKTETKKDVAPAADMPMVAGAPPPPPPPAAAPAPAVAPAVSSTQAVEVTAAPTPQVMAFSAAQDALKNKPALDVRALFYGNSLVQSGNSLVAPLSGGPGGQQGARKTAAAPMRATSGNLAKEIAFPPSIGVRVSLLRGDEEAPISTILNPGESVRLKLIPNEDGFLYVAALDGGAWKMVASGPAQRLKPFETPPLAFRGDGQKQLYVMLSRQAQNLSPQALAGLTRANLVETPAETDRATYVVANLQNGAPQQVVQSITLTYR